MSAARFLLIPGANVVIDLESIVYVECVRESLCYRHRGDGFTYTIAFDSPDRAVGVFSFVREKLGV